MSTIVTTIKRLVRRLARAVPGGDRGQTTAEYALVLLGAGAIAMLLLAWATETNRITSLLDTVFRSLTGLV